MTEKFGFIHQITKQYDTEGNEKVGRGRESYFLHVKGVGAVEVWRTKSPSGLEWTNSGYYGGIEVHYKNRPDDHEYMGESKSCWITGGKCWSTGSSLAFEQVEDHFDDPRYIQSVLTRWADGRILFGEKSEMLVTELFPGTTESLDALTIRKGQ